MTLLPKTLASLSLIPLSTSLALLYYNKIIIIHWPIMVFASMNFNLTVSMDWQGTLFSYIVLYISANVMNFSLTYMKEEKEKNRFNHLILIFILSMIMLIYIPNLITLLIGWDGLGMSSFLLVIYYSNNRSLSAGLLTALTNRLGDVFLLLALSITMNSGSWEMMFSDSKLQMLSILIAAMTKSAQLPFSSWLPAAMAAPTPVSALVHSSTLVTAGVYILIRFSPTILIHNSLALIILIAGLATSLMAGISASTEMDMKKIIALSTLSQLGFMMTSIGMGTPNLAFFHMCVHALFKALLFICAGQLIMANSHSQDYRLYNMALAHPLMASSIIISCTSLMGLPFMSAFYSKHLILIMTNHLMINFSILLMMILAIILTSLYTIRLIIQLSLSMLKSPIIQLSANLNLNHPLICMSSTTMISGSILNWLLIPMDPKMVSSTLDLMISLSFILAFMFFFTIPKKSFLLSSMLYLNKLSSVVNKNTINLSMSLNKHLDQTWLELSYSYLPWSQLYITSRHLDALFSKKEFSIFFSSIFSFFFINFMIF